MASSVFLWPGLFSNDGTTLAVVPANIASSAVAVGGTSLTAAGVSIHGTKRVTGIADNVATAILTWSAPNAEVSALIKVKVIGILGAGGAVGEGEAVSAIEFLIAVTRTAGANAVSAAASAAEATGAASVSGGATMTIARSLAAVSGGATATNTQAINITLAHGTGSSTNHIAVVEYSVLNNTATGVTVS